MLPWPRLQDRCEDGAPTPRIPSCAGAYPSPSTSANTRLTEPRETRAHCPSDVNTRNQDTWRDTRRLDTASRFIQGNMNGPPAAVARPWFSSPRHNLPDSDTGRPGARSHSVQRRQVLPADAEALAR